MKQRKPVDRSWRTNLTGKVPAAARDDVMIEVVRADASTLQSYDWNHDDLWRKDGCPKEIVQWRLV